MAVLVQHQSIAADAAGVAFTANPVTGDWAETTISAIQGFGERLVSGQATPDEWIVRNQEAMCRAAPEGAIDVNQVLTVAEFARRVEVHFGGTPQDIESALVGDELFLLQARPITALPEPVDMENLAAGCLGTPHQARRVAGRSGDAALRKLGASWVRGTALLQLPPSCWNPDPTTNTYIRQRLVLLLTQLSPVESR